MLNNLKKTIVILLCMMSVIYIAGCEKDSQIASLQKFIIKQVDCKTYQDAAGDMDKLKKVFEEYFEEGGYQEYLDDTTGYMYPQLYYVTNAKEVIIKSVVCNSINKSEGGLKQYNFTVQYQIVSNTLVEEKENTISMCDNIQIIIGNSDKIKKVVLLNSSDIIGELFLDIKVQ